MATNKNENNFEENDFEIIDANELETVSRGRKAIIDHKLLEIMKALPKGKVVKLTKFSVPQILIDSLSDAMKKNETESVLAIQKEIAKHKAKISAQVRTHAKSAKWENQSITWSTNGCPNVQRTSK